MHITYRSLLLVFLAAGLLYSSAVSAETLVIDGISCNMPEYQCPDADCSPETIGQRGNVTDVLTGRNYFLDILCDLQRGEDVTFVLNLHGNGSIGNWQRHYFPIMDYKDRYRLIIASPSGIIRSWREENDDEHLKNIVNYVYSKFDDVNIQAFWLAGHSQGGVTSHRLVCTEFFCR
jgi:pimeloyl-ACP methyl ester carboxylesterase